MLDVSSCKDLAKLANLASASGDKLDRRQSIGAAEAAHITGIAHRSLRRYATQGLIPGAFRVGKLGKWRFAREKLTAWIDQGAQATQRKQSMRQKPAWVRKNAVAEGGAR